MFSFAHVLPYDTLSQSKKTEDPNTLVRKLKEEPVGSESCNFATLAAGGEREVSHQKTKTQAPQGSYAGKNWTRPKSGDPPGYQVKNP